METYISPILIEAAKERGFDPKVMQEEIDMFADTLLQIFHNEKRNGRI